MSICKATAISFLNTPLLLQNPVLIPDGGGGTQVAWEDVGTVWAHIDSQGAKESERDGHQVMRVDHHIYIGGSISNSAKLDATMRFVLKEKQFYITGFYEDRRKTRALGRKIIKCMCEEYDGYA